MRFYSLRLTLQGDGFTPVAPTSGPFYHSGLTEGAMRKHRPAKTVLPREGHSRDSVRKSTTERPFSRQKRGLTARWRLCGYLGGLDRQKRPQERQMWGQPPKRVTEPAVGAIRRR